MTPPPIPPALTSRATRTTLQRPHPPAADIVHQPDGADGSGIVFRHRSRRALSPRQRVQYAVLAAIWIGVCSQFWWWWLTHAGATTPWMYWIDTVALLYMTTVMPTFFWYFVHRMRVPVE